MALVGRGLLALVLPRAWFWRCTWGVLRGFARAYTKGSLFCLPHCNMCRGGLTPKQLQPVLIRDALGGARVVNVACGFRHSVAVTEEGGCWTWGFGANGRLGHGNEQRVAAPKRIDPRFIGGAKAVMAACSSLIAGHSALVTHDGNLFTWGRGAEGQLGHPDLLAKLEPTAVPREIFGGAYIVLVACGGSHTACLTDQGAVWSWGAGDWGQLGHDDSEPRPVPMHVRGTGKDGQAIALITCGDRNTAAVTKTGELWTWGAGDSGRLGHNDEFFRLTPTKIAAAAFAGAKVVMADCGGSHMGAVTHDGKLWTWGSGLHGQLGHGDADTCPDKLVPTCVCGESLLCDVEFATLACGDKSTAAVAQDGRLWMWGDGSQGVLGLGCEDGKRVPEEVNAGIRIGRCRLLAPGCALAFAMSQHPRLGEKAEAQVLMPELVEKVLQYSHAWPTGPASKLPGLLRIMGGAGKVPPARGDDSEARSREDASNAPASEQQDPADESETMTVSSAGSGDVEAAAAVDDAPFLLPGNNVPLAPLLPSSGAARAATVGASADISPAQAALAGAVAAGVNGSASVGTNVNTVSTVPAPTNHVVLPVLRLGGGQRARPIFHGNTLVPAAEAPARPPAASPSTETETPATPAGAIRAASASTQARLSDEPGSSPATETRARTLPPAPGDNTAVATRTIGTVPAVTASQSPAFTTARTSREDQGQQRILAALSVLDRQPEAAGSSPATEATETEGKLPAAPGDNTAAATSTVGTVASFLPPASTPPAFTTTTEREDQGQKQILASTSVLERAAEASGARTRSHTPTHAVSSPLESGLRGDEQLHSPHNLAPTAREAARRGEGGNRAPATNSEARQLRMVKPKLQPPAKAITRESGLRGDEYMYGPPPPAPLVAVKVSGASGGGSVDARGLGGELPAGGILMGDATVGDVLRSQPGQASVCDVLRSQRDQEPGVAHSAAALSFFQPSCTVETSWSEVRERSPRPPEPVDVNVAPLAQQPLGQRGLAGPALPFHQGDAMRAIRHGPVPVSYIDRFVSAALPLLAPPLLCLPLPLLRLPLPGSHHPFPLVVPPLLDLVAGTS